MGTAPLAVVLAVVAGVGVAPATGPTPSPEPPPSAPPNVIETPRDLDATPAPRDQLTASAATCAGLPAVPVRDGKPVIVQLKPAKAFDVAKLNATSWSRPPVSDPTWQLMYYSLRWMGPLVRSAVEKKQPATLNMLITQAARFYALNPDRGLSRLGWDEGSSLRRLEALNCLYRMTKDKRLIPGMTTEVNLQFGPRYYGPPKYMAHNHGLMANERIVVAGQLLGKPAWIAKASARMRTESAMAFTPTGTSYEQSAMYHDVVLQMWSAAAATLAGINPKDPAVPRIRAVLRRATNVSQWLTEPDGRFVQYGDTSLVRGRPAPTRAGAGVLRDDRAGILVGRWSWKDPKTTYYSVRYGPARLAHGHHDKSAITWTTAGSRVLVGSGYFGSDGGSPYVAYHRRAGAANVAVPVGATARATPAKLTRAIVRGTRHRWSVADTVFGRNHGRAIDVDHPSRTLTVSDAFAGRVTADQFWHLDPSWTLVSARPTARSRTQVMRFRNTVTGRTLTVRTTGVVVSALRGSNRPVAGWNFPHTYQKVANWELRVRWTGGTVRTTFRVT